MTLTSTQTRVSDVPDRAMLDLEPLGGAGFSASYAKMVSAIPASRADHVLLIVNHDGVLVMFDVPDTTTVPVIAYDFQSSVADTV